MLEIEGNGTKITKREEDWSINPTLQSHFPSACSQAETPKPLNSKKPKPRSCVRATTVSSTKFITRARNGKHRHSSTAVEFFIKL